MEGVKARTVRAMVLAAVVAGLAVGAVVSAPTQAHAYAYLKTETSTIFNRHWIAANSSGYFEEIGADPHAPYATSEWNGHVKHYRFSIYNATDGRGWTDYYCTNGSWSRAGANFGHGVLESSSGVLAANAAGFGCAATYGYAWSREGFFSGADGLDDLYYSHVWIEDTVWGDNYYSAADFWPRVKIQYNANGGANAPGAHYKYIGNAGSVSSARPTRTGYTFEGWSTKKAGPVNIASGQRIGYEDWNLKKPMTIAHGWSGGPSDVRDDVAAGQPSPTGTNVITLYAQWKPISYTVSYAGNGATSGSTASSSHVYDAAKALTANGFARAYALTCNAQGGSAGNKTLVCTWGWKGWNTAAGGTGASYGNRASVRNLRSTPGTVTLYAQWNAGRVTLPSPGTKTGYAFAGWYTTAVGGSLVGRAGASVSIGKTTTIYARWTPVSYTVSYVGNGATSGSTAPSTHVYNAAKALTANGFVRSYVLACDAQGGSAGNKTLLCSWMWKAWNTVAGVTGASYADRASVKNLRASPGTLSLYAQWAPGKVALPSPGTKAGHDFAGWYTAASGGTLLGQVGSSISIDKATTCYARWQPRTYTVSYVVDGSALGEKSRVVYNEAHSVPASVTDAATKAGCSGFSGWFEDEACTRPYVPGTKVVEDMTIYGRNKVTLRYGLTDRAQALLSDRLLFLDEELAHGAKLDDLLPSARTLSYGDRVSIERGRSAWFEEHGRTREAVCEPGAYIAPDAAVPASGTLRLTGDTVVYLQWTVPAYDGIALS